MPSSEATRGAYILSRMRLYSPQQSSDAIYAFVTAPQMTASVRSGRSAVSLSLMSESNQPVVMVLCSPRRPAGPATSCSETEDGLKLASGFSAVIRTAMTMT